MPCGVVKWFNQKKGFGFLRLSNGEELFCHIRDIEHGSDLMVEGAHVECEIGHGPRGLRAGHVRVVEGQVKSL
jgi:CspA family cold shock protein